MDEEIKRLLYLDGIPNYILLPEEEKILAEWKAKQEDIKPEPKKKEKSNKLDGIGVGDKLTVEKVKNVVEDKTKN